MELQEMLAEQVRFSEREVSHVRSRLIQVEKPASPRLLPVSKLYRLRFSLETAQEKQSKDLKLHQAVEDTVPPGWSERMGTGKIDPRTLPPGVADLPMVTLVQAVDGQVTGGITYAITQGK